jgi:hypothetical protein
VRSSPSAALRGATEDGLAPPLWPLAVLDGDGVTRAAGLGEVRRGRALPFADNDAVAAVAGEGGAEPGAGRYVECVSALRGGAGDDAELVTCCE